VIELNDILREKEDAMQILKVTRGGSVVSILQKIKNDQESRRNLSKEEIKQEDEIILS
jgi:hypothetical protein